MKINEILDCFAKAYNDGNHYVVRSFWERKLGSVKQFTTIIYLLDSKGKTSEFIKVEYTKSVTSGLEEKCIEEIQKQALTEFIKKLKDDSGT